MSVPSGEPSPLIDARQLSPSSRWQQVLQLLRDHIVTGKLAPGTQLKQDAVAKSLNISQAPVREALRQLESEGLVEHEPNRGVFVTTITNEDLFGVLLPVRLAIETFAALRLQGDAISHLEGFVERMRAAAAAGDLTQLNELDVEFHEFTVRASGSRHAIQLWLNVQPRIRAQIYRLAPRHQELEEITDEHRLYVDTIKTGDGDAIRKLVHEHIIESALSLTEQAEATTSSTAAT